MKDILIFARIWAFGFIAFFILILLGMLYPGFILLARKTKLLIIFSMDV